LLDAESRSQTVAEKENCSAGCAGSEKECEAKQQQIALDEIPHARLTTIA
jgi:hypothetical protein